MGNGKGLIVMRCATKCLMDLVSTVIDLAKFVSLMSHSLSGSLQRVGLASSVAFYYDVEIAPSSLP